MKLRAVSKFRWRDHEYQIGEEVICADEKKAAMMIADGSVEAVESETVSEASVETAVEPVEAPAASISEPVVAPSTEPVDAEPVAPVSKKKVTKKKKR